MAWMSTATTAMALALAVAPGTGNVDPEGPRGTAEVTGEVRVQVDPAPYAALNGEGEGSALLEVEERPGSDEAAEGDVARFRARARLGEHRLEVSLDGAGRPANAREISAEEREAAREASGGVAFNGFWSGPVGSGDDWGTRRADILVWGTARVSLDGRELTDAARLELAAFAPTEAGSGNGADEGRLYVIVRDVPELSTLRMRFPEGVRVERSRADERPRDGERVASRSDGAATGSDRSEEGPGPQVLTNADELIPDEGPIPQQELADYVVVGTLPGPMRIEIDTADVDAPEAAGTGGSGGSQQQESPGASEQEQGSAAARDEGAASPDTDPGADVRSPEEARGTGGSGSQPGFEGRTRGTTGSGATDARSAPEADLQLPEGAGGSGGQDGARERTPEMTTGNDVAEPGTSADVDDQLVEGTGGSGSRQDAGGDPGPTTESGDDGRIRQIAPANIRIEADRVEVLQESPSPMETGMGTLSGVEPLNAEPAQETRVLSPGIEPLTSDVYPSSTGLPPPTEVNDGVLPTTVTFGPGARGANRFGPGVGGSGTNPELETQRQQQRLQEQSQGTVRPLGTLGDAPEMPAPIQPLNSAPATSMPQGIQPLNAQPAAPPR